MTRFDSDEYLSAFLAGGYPAIHDAIFNATAAMLPPGTRVLDLGACTGLLTARLQRAGYEVTAAEGNLKSFGAGAGVGTWGMASVWANYVTPETIMGFIDLLGERRIEAVVARRVTPEIFDSMGDLFYQYVEALTGSGVHTIILEGRKPSRRTTHPLGDADREAAAYAPYWRVTERLGDVRVLERGL